MDTDLGRIKGITKLSRNGSRFEAYIGIPYAEPPINELRFQVCKFVFLFNFKLKSGSEIVFIFNKKPVNITNHLLSQAFY